jgi:hypothetical protein
MGRDADDLQKVGLCGGSNIYLSWDESILVQPVTTGSSCMSGCRPWPDPPPSGRLPNEAIMLSSLGRTQRVSKRVPLRYCYYRKLCRSSGGLRIALMQRDLENVVRNKAWVPVAGMVPPCRSRRRSQGKHLPEAGWHPISCNGALWAQLSPSATALSECSHDLHAQGSGWSLASESRACGGLVKRRYWMEQERDGWSIMVFLL